jgi:large repetitive protein
MLSMSLQKRLRFEALENKIAPAALTVAVVDGDLVITGDAGANEFFLMKAPDFTGEQYEIVRRGQANDTVNGSTDSQFYFSGVTRDVIINLGAGDDIVRMWGNRDILDTERLVVPRDLAINTNGGNDQIYMGLLEIPEEGIEVRQHPVLVGRDLTINGGADDDFFMGASITTGDDFIITDTQGNNDYETIFTDTADIFVPRESSAVHGNLSVTLGAGADIVAVDDVVADGNVNINVAGGDDVVVVVSDQVAGNVTVSLGSGINVAEVNGVTIAGNLSVGGSGTNDILIHFSEIGSALNVLTNSNNDIVTINTVTSGSAMIATMGGQDNVQITDSTFDLLLVQLGSGNDTLGLTGVDAVLSVLIGGGGTDTYQDGGDNVLLLALDLGFEIFE